MPDRDPDPQSRSITLADREAYRRLGAGVSPPLPTISQQYIPTISFGDVSPLIPVPQPARGFGSMVLTATAGEHARFALEVTSPGGARINQMLIAATNTGGGAVVGIWDMTRGGGSSGLTERVSLNMGGGSDPAIGSSFHADVVVGAGPSGGVQIQPFVEFGLGVVNLAIFVPNGGFLQMAFDSTVAFIASIGVIWSELSDVSRSPD